MGVIKRKTVPTKQAEPVVEEKKVLKRKNPAKEPVKTEEHEAVESNALPAELKPGTRRVGVSKGVTVNLQNYESARISYWMERVIPDDDAIYMQEILDMGNLIEKLIAEEVAELKG